MIKTCIVIKLTRFISIHVNLLNTYIQLKLRCKHVWRQLNYIISILVYIRYIHVWRYYIYPRIYMYIYAIYMCRDSLTTLYLSSYIYVYIRYIHVSRQLNYIISILIYIRIYIRYIHVSRQFNYIISILANLLNIRTLNPFNVASF